ncbi:MAG: isoleucine--tRNA ligase [Candidatus Bruticola sp.]
MNTRFPNVDPRASLPSLEEETLKFWKEENIFAKSLEMREGAPEFVVYDGPPTANGNPGVHHVQARAYKDLFPRYKTMRGFKVRRKAGWDCHGLPVEIEVEKRLGFSGKPAIEKYGIEPFCRECRSSVMTYEGAWRQLTERIAYWTDLDNCYMTMSNDYVESVWWSLKELWNKGLLYLGYKVVPYCARCGTPLSSAEAGSAYKDVEDPSLYVRFPLRQPEKLGLPEGAALLVWTTTPWTLPGNVAACVHPDLEYVAAKLEDGRVLILARTLLRQALNLAAEVPEPEILASFKGSELAGTFYNAPYKWYDFGEKVGHSVVCGSFVTSEDGSGIVHIAPAFGADDLDVGRKNDLPIVHPVKTDGHFRDDAYFVAGLWFKEADPKIIDELRERGLLFRIKKYAHTYPHCWRCGTPLLYYATDSWYINNTSLQKRLIDKNQEIDWHPAHIKNGRYGDWLNNLVDWAISRTRYWGTPLPIWTCSECGEREAIGSYAELAERAEQDINIKAADFDPHRPHVDKITFKCAKCGGTMHRVPDVIDCWYDSGSMPFAQLHYPFENKELFEKSYPADFICEGLDQTRGWFNSLHQLGIMLFDKIAYKSVICHGLVLDGQGEKMSKSRGNVVNPWDVLKSHGADAIRWYLYTSAPPELSRRFSAELVGEASKHLSTWWNTWQFFLMNANVAEVDLTVPAPAELYTDLDKWILARLQQSIKEVTEYLEVYELTKAAKNLESFVDVLSNWYVRLNRRRFWENDAAAYHTLYECLVTLAQLQAPFTPFLAEEVWRNLVPAVNPRAPESVHLSSWPQFDQSKFDAQLLQDGNTAMQVISIGRSARVASKQKVRQPLSEVLIGVAAEADRRSVERFQAYVLDELNVKSIKFLSAEQNFLDYIVKPNLPAVGPRYGKLLGAIRKELSSDKAKQIALQSLAGQEVKLDINGTEVSLAPSDLLIEVKSPEGYAASVEGSFVAAVSTVITEELRLEGLARDLVRNIQELRKSSDFKINDRIDTWLEGAWDDLLKAVEVHRISIMNDTLSLSLSTDEAAPSDACSAEVEFVKKGPKVRIFVRRRG